MENVNDRLRTISALSLACPSGVTAPRENNFFTLPPELLSSPLIRQCDPWQGVIDVHSIQGQVVRTTMKNVSLTF